MPNDDRQEKEAIFKEIIRETELQLDTQLRFAISADQRGVYVATIYAALITGVVAGTGALLSVDKLTTPYAFGLIGALAPLLAALGLALWSVRPAQMHGGGSQLEDWRDDLENNRTLSESLVDVAQNLAERIKQNHEVLDRNGKLIWRSILIGFSAPLIGFAGFLIALVASTS